MSELKAHLSKYLRQASRGARIIVHDRDQPVAQLAPLDADAVGWPEQLVRAGRIRLGTQRWNDLRISKTRKRIDIQASLQAVKEEPSEVRRR